MIVLYVALIVLMGDQALKLLLRRRMGSGVLALGPFGEVRIVTGRLWLRPFGGNAAVPKCGAYGWQPRFLWS
jgi:hypothetical protein